MSKLLIFMIVYGCINAIAPAWAESINIRFTGVVEERVSVNISAPQANSVEIAAHGSAKIQIPPTSIQRTLSINSSQPVSVQVTSNLHRQGKDTSMETVIGKAELRLPIDNKNSTSKISPERITITVVPH